MTHPIIGITMDVSETNGRLKYDVSAAYAACIVKAGGTPVLLPPIAAHIPRHVEMCSGFVLTGGDDPKMEAFGVATHPQAKVIHPDRQAYELGLLAALEAQWPDKPVLGVCLGMQLMCLHAGGTLNQFLPDTLASHAMHKNQEHTISPERGPLAARFVPKPGTVWSNHRQAVDDPGSLEVIARSDDEVVEAVARSNRGWYLGLQWHPERTGESSITSHVFKSLVGASSSIES